MNSIRNIFLILALIFSYSLKGQVSNNPAPYCMPQYGTTCTGPGVNDHIASFSTTGALVNISNLNSGCTTGGVTYPNTCNNCYPNNYIYYECNFLEVDPGTSFNFTIVSGAPFSQGFAIWIDWDDDGVFNNTSIATGGELVYSNGNTGQTPQNGVIDVPPGQPCGPYRMRVRSNYIGAPGDPCANQTFGEVEDYNIFVNGPGCSTGSTGSTTSTISQIEACLNETVDLEVNGGPYSSIQWYSASTVNGVYTPIPGATNATYTHTVTGDACFYAECIYCNNTILSDTNCVTLFNSSNPPDSITSVTYTDAYNTNEICLGDSAELTAHGGTLGTNGEWYWYENGCGTGAPIDSGQVIMVNPIVTTTYFIRGEDDCGNSTCEEIEIVVNPIPNVNAGLDAEICNTDTITLTATGSDNYGWNNGLGAGNNFEVFPSVTTEYIVEGTNNSGCRSSDTILVTVNPLPTVILPNDFEVCNEDIINITATGADNYDWDNGIQNGVDFTQNIGTTEYTVIGTDVNGCKDTNSISVTVFPDPVVTAGNDWEICDNESVTLTATGANTYLWNNGIQNGVAFNPTQTGTYIVEGTDLNGCTDKDTVEVVVYLVPDPQVGILQPEGCAPFTGMFTNLTTGLTGDEFCKWEFGDGSTYIGCEDYGRTYENPGCYNITLTINNNGCVGSSTFDNLVCINPSPVANFNFNPAIPTTSEPTITFNNFSTGAVDYQWFIGEITSTQAENPVVEFPAEPGNHEVTLIASNEFGCTDTATSVLTIFEDLIFYVPNSFTPDGDSFNEVFKPEMTSGFDTQEYRLLIFNRWGELIFESRNPEIGWNGTFKDKNAEEGTYVWKIEIKVTTADERKEYFGHVNLIR